MNLSFNSSLALKYKNNSQKIRVLTEDWVKTNLYCPICGELNIIKYENNHPVGDFYCSQCNSDFELKSKESKSGKLSNLINDGAYDTFITRITSNNNPNFFFLTYNNYKVTNFILIPNHFFTPSIVIKRKPLGPNARRSGWVGCNIDISRIPELGKIFIIKDKNEISHNNVIEQYAKTKILKTDNIETRGWLLDILQCVDKISETIFTLDKVYSFENELKLKHKNNNFIKDKIRQQLQKLRDKGLIEFLGNGKYRKI